MTEVPQQRMVQINAATVESINLALTLVCTWLNELGGFGGGAPIANLTANRLVKSDENQAIASVEDLTEWIAGYAGRITVTDLLDGRVQLSMPDKPSFVNILLSELSPLRLTATAPDGSVASVRDLMEWAYGTAHQIILDNSAGDGTIIIGTPQDIDLDSSPTFRTVKIVDDTGTLIHGMGDV